MSFWALPGGAPAWVSGPSSQHGCSEGGSHTVSLVLPSSWRPRTVSLVLPSSWRPQKKKAERWSAVGRLADSGPPGRLGRARLHRTAPVPRSRNRIWGGRGHCGGQRGGCREELEACTGTHALSHASPGGRCSEGGRTFSAALTAAASWAAAPSAFRPVYPQLRTKVPPPKEEQRTCLSVPVPFSMTTAKVSGL